MPTQLLNIDGKKKKVNFSLSLIETVLGKIKSKDKDVDYKKLAKDLPQFRQSPDLAPPPAMLGHEPPPVPAAVAPAPGPAPTPAPEPTH